MASSVTLTYSPALIRLTIGLAACLAILTAPAAHAQADRVYFPAVDNVTNVMVSHINAETERIDMSAWYLTERTVSVALVNAFNRDVQIRLIGDRGAIFEIDPRTKNEFYWLASRGVPIRLRSNPDWFPEIAHWKATIFKGQHLVAFGSANYTPFQLAPASSTNYSDETVLFTTDPALVGAFLTRFDVLWNDTAWEPESRNPPGPPYFKNWDDACASESACSDYRRLYPNPVPMGISTARLEPDYPTPPDLIWGQGAAFNSRLVQEIASEPRAIKLVVYRLTVDDITNALLERHQAGVPTQLIVEPAEYLNRKWPEFWLTHANIDKLWAAGVPIKQRQHAGLTHMKMLVTSRYATNGSSNFAANWQRDHNYFVPAGVKPTVYRAMNARFDTMWNDTAGFVDFVPGPPDQPSLASPVGGATGVSRTPTLRWNAAAFATAYDVYLGTSPGALSLVARVPALLVNDPPPGYSWTIPGQLAGGTAFYWRVVARTNATERDPSIVAGSATRWFTTEGTALAGGGTGDFDGDGRADAAVWRPSTGVWWIRNSEAAYLTHQALQWGSAAERDVPAPADFDGDGKLDPAVWRPGPGLWYVLRSSDAYRSHSIVQWGAEGDVPVPADYDGDGRADPAVWRPSSGTWYLLPSGSGLDPAGHVQRQWGLETVGDVPVPADYDGDGRADLAVWRPTDGVWYVLTSRSNYQTYFTRQWGAPGDVPVVADYDGDGRADPSVWRPSTGTWYCLKSQGNYTTYLARVWGLPGDVPTPADYDGDGLTDLVVWRPSTGSWYALTSGQNFSSYSRWTWGIATDIPATR